MTFKRRVYVCSAGHATAMFRWDTDSAPVCGDCGASTVEDGDLYGKAPCVVGDECDVWVRHGICNPDGTPKHYTSKAAMREAATALGLENRVRHIPMRGSDKSPHTTRWT